MDQTRHRNEVACAQSHSKVDTVHMWADARFEGLAFEQVALTPGRRRIRLHQDYVIVLVSSGSGIISSRGAEYRAESGSGFLFGPDLLWTARAESDVLCYRMLQITPDNLARSAEQREVANVQLASLTGAHVLDSKTREAARRALDAFEAHSSLLHRVAALVELAEMVASACRHGEATDDEPRVSRMCSLLREHAFEHLPISQLADIVSMTPYHLIRVFHRATGVPPHCYAMLVRLCRAEGLLRAGIPIADAAVRTGFYDQSHLNRCFRRILGTTPGQYQKTNFFPARPIINSKRVMEYRLRTGERLLTHWIKLRSARGYRSC